MTSEELAIWLNGFVIGFGLATAFVGFLWQREGNRSDREWANKCAQLLREANSHRTGCGK